MKVFTGVNIAGADGTRWMAHSRFSLLFEVSLHGLDLWAASISELEGTQHPVVLRDLSGVSVLADEA